MDSIRAIALGKAAGGSGGGGGQSITVEALNVTENGTYTAPGGKAYSPVTVNVSGGGGEVTLLSSGEWNALTTEEKQAYGLVAIQQTNTGYGRGELVNGADYSPIGIHLPFSNQSNIICSASGDIYDSTKTSWGYGTNPVTLSAAGSVLNQDGSVAIKTKTNGTLAYVDLGATKTAFTAYIVAKVALSNGTYTRELSCMASRSSGQGLMLYGNPILVSSWANESNTQVSSSAYFVGILRYGGSYTPIGAAIEYIEYDRQPTFITKSPGTVGRYLTIGRTDIDPSTYNAEPSDMDVLYFGVVSVAESTDVITLNMQYLAREFLS